MCFAFGCNSQKEDREIKKIEEVIIGTSFTTVDVNNKAWLCKVTEGQHPALAPLLKNFRKNFKRSTNASEITIGKAYKYPEAWIYIPITNKTKTLKNLVVGVGHNRCDTVTAFLLHNGSIKPVLLDRLYRNLSLNERAIPLRSFAIPFVMLPNETLALVLHTKRVTGIHEVNLSLSNDKSYVSKNFNDNFIRFSTFSITCFFVFALLSLGIIFRHKLLVLLALYASTIAIGQFSFLYFFDDFPYPDWVYLNGNSIGILIIFSANVLMYPFSIAYIKSVYKFKRWHRLVIWMFSLSATFPILLIFFSPITPLVNMVITNTSLILTTLGIFWLFYIGALGVTHKKQNYLLITVSLMFIPILLKTYIAEIAVLNYGFLQSIYLLLILAYLTVSLFKQELTSRALTSQQIKFVENQLENVRKTEIKSIGRNLHDQLGNTLASAMGYLNLNQPNILVARKMIFNSINEIRLLSHNLVKNDERNLSDKLEDIIERFNDFSPILFEYKNFTENAINRLTPLKQESIYMVIQEALNNVIKHSNAKEAVIQVFLIEGTLRFTVEDDGVGYDRTQKSNGIGLLNMQTRASLANLNLSIDSGTGGTMIIIESTFAEK